MSTPPHQRDPSQDPSFRRVGSEGEPTVPRPLPQDEGRAVRMALGAIVIAAIAVVLVILL
jgi:hypothetical protein